MTREQLLQKLEKRFPFPRDRILLAPMSISDLITVLEEASLLKTDGSGHCECNDLRAKIKELEKFLLENYGCPEAVGFEGPDTFSDCGKCLWCITRRA